MIRLVMARAEAETLLRLLEYYHGELRMEIIATDRAEYREQLKTEKRMLTRIRRELGNLLEANTKELSRLLEADAEQNRALAA